jgi:hypothetical protein
MFFAYVMNSSLSIVMEVQVAWLTQAIFLCIKASNFEDFVEFGDNKLLCIFNPGSTNVLQSASGCGQFIPLP